VEAGRLDGALRGIVELWGVDSWGVADLERAKGFIVDQGGEALAAYARAVVLGVMLPHAIVDLLAQRVERSVAVAYKHQYETVNRRLDLVASQVTSLPAGPAAAGRPDLPDGPLQGRGPSVTDEA